MPATQTIVLPSKGRLYDGKIPEGKVVVREMMTQDEAALFTRGVESTARMSTLLNSCLLNKEVPGPELLIVDRFAILLAIRTLSYGSEYEALLKCPHCNGQFKHLMDIQNELEIHFMGETDDGVEIPEFGEPFLLTLPSSGTIIKFRLLRGKDESAIAKLAKRMRLQSADPSDPSYIHRMALQLVEVDGKPVDLAEATKFVSTMTARDSRAFQLETERVERGIDTTLHVTCTNPACGADFDADMPLTAEFFRPSRV